MKYQISQLKLEQLVSYFKDNVIDLTPAFQRGRVWIPKMRQSLLKNILQGKPVPAIFLYKKPTGSKNSYIILDGKQRLESILLYIGDQRNDLRVPVWKGYFFRKKDKDQAHFKANINGQWKKLKDLSDEEILRFRDYLLSIIEIDFDDTATLDEIIQLFVDINQSGVKVKRFDIVKALYLKDKLLLQIFNLIAIKQGRRQDTYYKMKKTSFCRVLKQLDVVSRVDDSMNRVDIMWEKLFELALFAVSGRHRKPVQILKEFISRNENEPSPQPLTHQQVGLLTNVFGFIAKAYKNNPKLSVSRLATDQTHFYILVTSLINEARSNPVLSPAIVDKLIRFEMLLSTPDAAKLEAVMDVNIANMQKIFENLKKYVSLSAKQTTDPPRRQEREQIFREILRLL
ncbi:MAG TPA: DUF262 domain-containing protein [Candidatus Sulfopaludibacter sp.]|nr:DUF262 domain-containing protein [Candidatus Sulfopaludibacter sp.]